MAEAALAELAARHGIELEYHDVWGGQHSASDATLRALLAAMHVDASSAETIAAAIAAHDRAQRAQILPPAVVVRQSALALGARAQLPQHLNGHTLTWRITEESGGVHDNSCGPCTCSASSTGDGVNVLTLPLPAALEPGYHRWDLLDGAESVAAGALIVTPERCYEPAALAGGGRVWGGALQLYSLRSARNWGIGDYTDLRVCIEQWAAGGAAIIGVSPLHALFMHDPAHASPYSPSSRIFLNVLYLDVEACADFHESQAAQELARAPGFVMRLKQLRDGELVDYAGVAAAKRQVLELLFANFEARHLGANSARAREFHAFRAARGEALLRYAQFEAIQEHLRCDDPRVWGWQQWPQDYRDPNSAAVAQFAVDHARRIDFFAYLQWQADLQLAAAEERCFELEFAIGLYVDLAVSVDRGGAEAWANQALYALGASIGAPPDEFNRPGQDWGLPPLNPSLLRASAYAPLIATLRANMQRAGALRVDHVMGLARMYWVPPNMRAREGAYVRYPFEEILGIVALESQRNRCLVIGEDLGTVPPELRAGLQNAGVLSYRLLIFERDGAGRLIAPADYPRQALAACSTHDLPTMAGYWHGQDLLIREALGTGAEAGQRDAQVLERGQARAALLLALERESLLPAGASVNPAAMPAATPEFLRALHVYLARSAAAVMIVQFEDVLGVLEQANMPGTIDEHPNWRRKLPLALERWPADARFRGLAAQLGALRAATHNARPRAVRARTEADIPRATYRLQLHRDFRFEDATALVPYLAALGVSHVYCSPYLRARAGSMHGYDIVDHGTLNPEIGTREDFDAFAAALARHGMGQIADVVPNHMGVFGADNAWWLDVLENGPASAYADFFDIDWQPASHDLADRVLLPVLGDHYGHLLNNGEFVLQFDAAGGSFSVHYNEHRFPVDPREYPRILEHALAALAAAGPASEVLAEFKTLVSAFSYLPVRSERTAAQIAERGTNKEVHKRALVRLAGAHAEIGTALAGAVAAFNGRAGDAASFDALHALLEAQAYRLAYWRVASDEINYRRFFDINHLAALRMENDAVFEATHQLLFDWLRTGAIAALRIDHPDGLSDPAAYFLRLQDRYRRLKRTTAEAPKPLYVAIEKIIAPFENMPESWAVHGTTGYRYANVVNGLFVDGNAEDRLTRTYRAFTGEHAAFEEIAMRSKRLILRTALASELTVLANQLARIAGADRNTRDYTLNTLRQALAEVIAEFPVYRTYIAETIAAADRRYIEWAVARARRHSRAADTSIFDFIRAVLLHETAADGRVSTLATMRAFTRRFQQLTAPVMAKGVEDTAFYIYNRLLSLNDVGGDPAAFGCSVAAFHGASADRAAKWPHTMLATSTHDNKRSEDVRARIDVLSEFASAWRLQLRRWSRMNRSKKRKVDGAPAPSRNDEYMLYQTLIGTFSLTMRDAAELKTYCGRVEAYMLKAVREAKVHTSWVTPGEQYEAATVHFVQALLAPGRNLFLDDFRAAVAPIAWLGMLNSLSLTLIKYTSPGVPDCYQGNELWDFSMVDPDNRRPVDYARRQEALAALTGMAQDNDGLALRVRALCDAMDGGQPKLYLIWRLLALRRARRELFAHGTYAPLQAAGARAEHVVAFARRRAGAEIIAVAGRLYGGLGAEPGKLPCGTQFWEDTWVEAAFLDDGAALKNVLTGETLIVRDGRIRVAEAHANFPGAVFEFERGDGGAP